MKTLLQVIKDVSDIRSLPEVSIDLMYGETKHNDPFYGRIVKEFYGSARKRHPKFPLVRAMEYGVAVCKLPQPPGDYPGIIEASARRNYKKALRAGYKFCRIDYNAFLDDITAIRKSAEVRQGRMPDELLKGKASPCANPPTLTDVHDYPYFGVLKEDRLAAYAGCLVSGEMFMIEQIYGHAAHQAEGVVPMLIIEMAGYIPANYPKVRYYAYGTYFGAGATMRRFKTKFGFCPHRVNWILG